MKKKINPASHSQDGSPSHSQWVWLLLCSCAVVVLIGILHVRTQDEATSPFILSTEEAGSDGSTDLPSVDPLARTRLVLREFRPALEPTAEEIIATKISQFARSRRDFAHALALRHGVEISEDVERFFTAVESGVWEDIEAAFKRINGGDSTASHSGDRHPDLTYIWPAIIDAYGVAQEVHEWPAQQLLDYGNAVLDSLRPGMVYVGGTDSGRWIPALLNDTSEGERHIMVTQNAFADSTYLNYLQLQYEGRFTTLTPQDSERAFHDYLIEVQNRLHHDEMFPDEPKQIRPGENVRWSEGRLQISGQTAVMAINEKLLESLMAKNPDLSFAIQESFPLKNTYANALPLGPLMELGARDAENRFTAERASESLDYWRNTAQQILWNPEVWGSPSVLKSYAHDTTAAANLLAAHNFTAEAEQAYRLALQFWPENNASVSALSALLVRSGRETEGRQMVEEFIRQYPGQWKE